MFKVNNNKLTLLNLKELTLKNVFIVNFGHISHLVPAFLLLILKI